LCINCAIIKSPLLRDVRPDGLQYRGHIEPFELPWGRAGAPMCDFVLVNPRPRVPRRLFATSLVKVPRMYQHLLDMSRGYEAVCSQISACRCPKRKWKTSYGGVRPRSQHLILAVRERKFGCPPNRSRGSSASDAFKCSQTWQQTLRFLLF
jgi:hypothetical protein